MAEDTNVLKMFEAVEGFVLKAKDAYQKATSLIKQNRHNLARPLVEEVYDLLDKAYKESLFRRHRTAIRSLFRVGTLSVLEGYQKRIMKETAAFQALVESVKGKFEDMGKLLEKIQKTEPAHQQKKIDILKELTNRMLQKDFSEKVALLFTFPNRILTMIREVPSLRDHYADFLAGTGEFAQSNREEMAEVWNVWRMEMDYKPLPFRGRKFEKNLVDFHLNKCSFDNCIFQKIKLYFYEETGYAGCEFKGVHILHQSEWIKSLYFKGCTFIRLYGVVTGGQNSIMDNCTFRGGEIGIHFGDGAQVSNITVSQCSGDSSFFFSDKIQVSNFTLESSTFSLTSIGCQLNSVQVTGCKVKFDLRNSILMQSQFLNCNLGGYVERPTFTEARFRRCKINFVCEKGSDFSEALFEDCVLDSAEMFSDGNFKKAVFKNTIIKRMQRWFPVGSFDGAVFDNINFFYIFRLIGEAKIVGITVQNLEIGEFRWDGSRNIVFENSFFKNVNFGTTRMPFFLFSRCTFENCDFSKTEALDQCHGIPPARVKEWRQLHQKAA